MLVIVSLSGWCRRSRIHFRSNEGDGEGSSDKAETQNISRIDKKYERESKDRILEKLGLSTLTPAKIGYTRGRRMLLFSVLLSFLNELCPVCTLLCTCSL